MQGGFHTRHVYTGVGGAIESLTRGLALNLAPIRVNTVIPGVVSPGFALQLQDPTPATMVNNAAERPARLQQYVQPARAHSITCDVAGFVATEFWDSRMSEEQQQTVFEETGEPVAVQPLSYLIARSCL